MHVPSTLCLHCRTRALRWLQGSRSVRHTPTLAASTPVRSTPHNRPLAFLQFWPTTLTAAQFDAVYAQQQPQLVALYREWGATLPAILICTTFISKIKSS
jgi:hypothetical protein